MKTESTTRTAIFLDRDGTINEDHGYLYKPEDLSFETGAVEGLQLLQKLGFLLIVTTNQSGIGRGLYSEDDFTRFMQGMQRRLQVKGVNFDAVYFCPHHPTKGQGSYLRHCSCRKPQTGMIRQAVADFYSRGVEVNLAGSYVIGDKTADGKLGNSVGCRSILVRCPSGKQGKDGTYSCLWNHEAANVYDAALWIADQKTTVKVNTVDNLTPTETGR